MRERNEPAMPVKTYEKPTIKKQDKMTFPLRGVENVNKELACRQCSSCHGCR